MKYALPMIPAILLLFAQIATAIYNSWNGYCCTTLVTGLGVWTLIAVLVAWIVACTWILYDFYKED